MKAISPWIYETNFDNVPNAKLNRIGGNRLTGYNWENNASNAGGDWYHHSGGGDGVLAEWTYDFNAGQVTANSYRELFKVNMPNFDHPIKQAKFNPYAVPIT